MSQKSAQKLAYDPSEIRTGNMLPYRGSDLDFAGEVSLTKQAELASTDINNIMSQYEKTGLLAHVNKHQGQYADLGNALSFHESMNVVKNAQNAFMELPANIRSRFGNDPAAFLDFVNNPDNLPEMEKLGLVLPSEVSGIPLPGASSDKPRYAPVDEYGDYVDLDDEGQPIPDKKSKKR